MTTDQPTPQQQYEQDLQACEALSPLHDQEACRLEARNALIEARKLKDRTVFIDFQTDPTENVFPMVQAGKGITEMLLGSEDL